MRQGKSTKGCIIEQKLLLWTAEAQSKVDPLTHSAHLC